MLVTTNIKKREMNMEGKELAERVLASADWQLACDWGEPRPGHPEGTVGRHVNEQLLPFIDRWYADLPDYWNLVALAYLHDIAKPVTRYENGKLSGDSHSVLSANIAQSLGAEDRLVQVIFSNDRAYSHWRKLLDKNGVWHSERWTQERRERFVDEFGRAGLDLELLVLFHRADNAYRRPEFMTEANDSVLWFEKQLLSQDLLPSLPEPGKDQRLAWCAQ